MIIFIYTRVLIFITINSWKGFLSDFNNYHFFYNLIYLYVLSSSTSCVTVLSLFSSIVLLLLACASVFVGLFPVIFSLLVILFATFSGNSSGNFVGELLPLLLVELVGRLSLSVRSSMLLHGVGVTDLRKKNKNNTF